MRWQIHCRTKYGGYLCHDTISMCLVRFYLNLNIISTDTKKGLENKHNLCYLHYQIGIYNQKSRNVTTQKGEHMKLNIMFALHTFVITIEQYCEH